MVCNIASDKAKQVRLAVFTITIVGLMIFLVGLVIPAVIVSMFSIQLENTLVVDSKAAENFEHWRRNTEVDDPPVSFEVYFWNITNLQEIQNGMVPRLKEIGPYFWKQHQIRFNVSFYNEGADADDPPLPDGKSGDLVKFYAQNWFEFDMERSAPYKHDDEIVMPNAAYVVAILGQAGSEQAMSLIVTTPTYAPEMQKLFMQPPFNSNPQMAQMEYANFWGDYRLFCNSSANGGVYQDTPQPNTINQAYGGYMSFSDMVLDSANKNLTSNGGGDFTYVNPITFTQAQALDLLLQGTNAFFAQAPGPDCNGMPCLAMYAQLAQGCQQLCNFNTSDPKYQTGSCAAINKIWPNAWNNDPSKGLQQLWLSIWIGGLAASMGVNGLNERFDQSGGSLFSRRTASEWMDYYPTDPLLSLFGRAGQPFLCGVPEVFTADNQQLTSDDRFVDKCNLGYMYQYTGKHDIDLIGYFQGFRSMEVVPAWNPGHYCNPQTGPGCMQNNNTGFWLNEYDVYGYQPGKFMTGSTNTFSWNNGVSRSDFLEVMSASLFRRAYFNYSMDTKVQGIDTYRFYMDTESFGAINPEYWVTQPYLLPMDKALGGLPMNFVSSRLRGIPSSAGRYFAFTRLTFADDDACVSVPDGSQCFTTDQPDLYSPYFDVEPTLGTALQFHERQTFVMGVPTPSDGQYANMYSSMNPSPPGPAVLYPMFSLDRHNGEFSDDTIDGIETMLTIMDVTENMVIVMPILGGIILLIGIGLSLILKKRSLDLEMLEKTNKKMAL